MREIKFRGYNKDFGGNHFVYGETILFQECRQQWVMLIENELGEQWVDIKEPQQYVGINDKNGTEIYEGDILVWEEGGCRNTIPHWVIYDYTGFKLSNERYHKTIIDPSWYEVVGNIYENPELLA